MKRYALLCGPTYYPPPGFQAFDSWHDAIETAETIGKVRADECYGWWQVVDMQTGEIVAGEGDGHTGLFGKFPANPHSVANDPNG